jgi:hypothetical protein
MATKARANRIFFMVPWGQHKRICPGTWPTFVDRPTVGCMKLAYLVELEVPEETTLSEAEAFWAAVRATLNGRKWDGWKAKIKRKAGVKGRRATHRQPTDR